MLELDENGIPTNGENFSIGERDEREAKKHRDAQRFGGSGEPSYARVLGDFAEKQLRAKLEHEEERRRLWERLYHAEEARWEKPRRFHW